MVTPDSESDAPALPANNEHGSAKTCPNVSKSPVRQDRPEDSRDIAHTEPEAPPNAESNMPVLPAGKSRLPKHGGRKQRTTRAQEESPDDSRDAARVESVAASNPESRKTATTQERQAEPR